jgi:predicted DNA-binding transcriptional regulator YafY
MRRADRLLKVIQLLRRHRRPVTGQAMAGELEISLRTLYRDIADLITDGVPIRGEAGVGYVLGEGYDLPPLMFKADELEAVMLGLRWVARRGDPDLARAAQDTAAKIGTVLPTHLKTFLYDSSLIASPFTKNTPDKIDVAALRRAIREQHKVSLHYKDENSTQSQRIIWPIGIAYFDAQRVIIAWCEMRQDFRSFRTDRVIAVEFLKEKYKERRKALLTKWQEKLRIEADEPLLDVFS